MTKANFNTTSALNHASYDKDLFGKQQVEALNEGQLDAEREALGVTDTEIQASELYPEFLQMVLVNTAERPGLAPRNEFDIQTADFVQRASNLALDDIIPRVFGIDNKPGNLLKVHEKVTLGVAKQWLNTAVFMAIARHNADQRVQDTLAKIGITEQTSVNAAPEQAYSGVPNALATEIFGAYAGAEKDEVPSAVLYRLVDMLYVDLAAAVAMNTPKKPLSSNRFNTRRDDGLPYLLRKHPVTGEYISFWSLEDAIAGSNRLRELSEELQQATMAAERRKRGSVDWGNTPATQAQADAPAEDNKPVW